MISKSTSFYLLGMEAQYQAMQQRILSSQLPGFLFWNYFFLHHLHPKWLL